MKKTWKQLLGSIAPTSIWGKLAGGAALSSLALGTFMGPVFGQGEEDGVVVLGRGVPQATVAPQSYDEGSVQLNDMGAQPQADVSTPAYADGTVPVGGPPVDAGYTYDDPTIHPTGVYGGDAFAPHAAGGAVGYAVTQDPEDVLLRVGRRNGDIYGVDEGFTSIGAFLTHHEDANTVWFTVPRLILTDQGRGGLNLGFGQKAYYPDLDRVFSLSGWWDFDSGHQSDYHQVGLSFEMIGQNLSLRSNANFVVSRDEHQFGATNFGPASVDAEGGMIQQQLIFNEVAYNQADVELSTPMPLIGDYGWEWGAGAYFLFGGDGRDATGVRGRIESQISEDLWVNAIISSDRVFDTNVSVNLELTIPNAPSSRWWRRPSPRDHLWSSVRRPYRVVTDVVEKTRVIPVMVQGPGGVQRMRVGFVDPNVTDDPSLALGGSGTMGDPWLSIADYMDEALTTQEQFSIIAVKAREDGADINLNTTIVLLNNQKLLGEGVRHVVNGGEFTVSNGFFQTTGDRPLLTNSEAPANDVVTLADNNQVSGFMIDAGGTASGIVGDSGIRSFRVTQVDMTNVNDGIRVRSVGDGVGVIGGTHVSQLDGTVIDLGNRIDAQGGMTPEDTRVSSTRGISIEHVSGTLALLIANNDVRNFQGEDANANGMLDPSEDLNMNGRLDAKEDVDFDGILDLSEDLDGDGMLDAGFGIYVEASNGSSILANDPFNLTQPLGILENTLIANGTGMSIVATGGSTIVADVQDNVALNSSDFGEDANRDGMLTLGEDLNGNGILDIGSGFNVFADGSNITLFTFTGNIAAGEVDLDGDGLPDATGQVDIDGDGSFDADFNRNNQLDMAAGNGATFQTFNGGSINLINPNVDPNTLLPAVAFSGNVFDGNPLDGLLVRADSGSVSFDQIIDSVFTNNGDDGLDMETDNGGAIFIRDPLTGNTFVNNGDNGLEVTAGGGGSFNFRLGDAATVGAVPNTISGNGTDPSAETGAGVFISTDGGIVDASLQGVTSSNNAGSGVVIFADGGGLIQLDGIAGNVFRLNGEHGLALIANNGSQIITPFIGSADILLDPEEAQMPGQDFNGDGEPDDFSNDFSLNEIAGLFVGGSNDIVGSAVGKINLGTVTLNRFQRVGEDIDNDGRVDVMEVDADGNGLLDPAEDLDGDGRLDVAENISGVIDDNILNPSQGEEGILFDATDLTIHGQLTRNAFIGRLPVSQRLPSVAGVPINVIPAASNGVPRGGGSSFGIGGLIDGSSVVPGGLNLQIGTVVEEDQNIFLDNGESHIGLILAGNTINTIVIENGTFNDAFDVRTINQPLGQRPTGVFQGEGVHYVLRDTARLTGGVFSSTFTGNESDGLLIEIAGNNDFGNTPLFRAAELNNFAILDSLFANNGLTIDQDLDGIPDPTLASGIHISRTERGQFNDLLIANNVTGAGFDRLGNPLRGNTENGIKISSVGANQLNLPNLRADTVMILNNEITGNFQDGVELIVGADADMAVRMDSNLITNNGFGEVIIPGVNTTNVGNGVEARERVQDAKDSRSITGLWTNNIFTDNFDDGVDLSAFVGNVVTDLAEAGVYTVAPPPPGSTFPTLGRLETFGLVIGDIAFNPVGATSLTTFNNLIDGNLGDGIDITGGGSLTIANNRITNNGTSSVFPVGTPLIPPNTLLAQHAGINIDGAELNENIGIRSTGRDPRTLPNDDFDPERDAFRDVFIYSNLITLNNGDGIEFLSEPSFDGLDSASSGGAGGTGVQTRLTIAQNEITLNAARGIDILQRAGDSDGEDRDNEDPDGVTTLIDSSFISADVSIIGNHIKGNQQEGIYIVQTVDNVQNQISPSHITVTSGGASLTDPNNNGIHESLRAQGTTADIDDFVVLRIDIHDNFIIGNGDSIIDFPASGLVVRVGTSGGTPVLGGYLPPVGDPNFASIPANFFATSGFNLEDVLDPDDLDGDGVIAEGDGLLDNDQDGDGFLDAAPVTGSGISMSVTGNTFDGNFGDDMLFHSFTATVDPVTTGDTWNDMQFTPMPFQADPLARFDLILSNNRFNSIEANNLEATIGTSPGNAETNGPADAGAYYDNDETTFKSREAMQGGPFANGNMRQRNATRFASRYLTGDVLPPLISPDLGVFKYPGMGNTTFRVRGTGNAYTDQLADPGTLPFAVDLDQLFIFDLPELGGDPDLVDTFNIIITPDGFVLSEANGVFPSSDGAFFGELPWGWDDLEPGTPALPLTGIGVLPPPP